MKPTLRDGIRVAISNAYYDARNGGATMEQAADDALDAVADVLLEWVGNQAIRVDQLASGSTAVDAEFLWGVLIRPGEERIRHNAFMCDVPDCEAIHG